MADIDKKNTSNLSKPEIKIVSLEELEKRLKGFEKKYNMTSDVFYKRAIEGLLEEKDDYITWLGHYEAYVRYPPLKG